jgi:hypothetical protein
VIAMAEIVLQQIVFLATASDSEINPDVAVAQLEALAHAVRELPQAEREAFNAALTARISVAAGDELGALHELEEMLDV